VWKWAASSAAWYFHTLDKKARAAVDALKRKRVGWGSIPVEVTIKNTTWQTSIFPDKNRGWILPIKVAIRKKEDIIAGDKVTVTLQVKS
jgi:hypothetical protein